MAAGERTLTVKILGDSSGAQRAFAKLEDASNGIGGKLASLAGALGKVFVASGVAATAFGVKAVLSASDLAETMSKVGIVFGEQQKVVTNFADQMAKDFGTPKREILDAAAAIGLIGKASGLSQGDAAKMSTQLAKLATDAASFYNVPLPEALAAIQSGLVGEAEPLRRFGVLLNAQTVNAEAARLGLAKVGKEYSEGAKAQARASLIMSGMTDATGDLERTQGSLANRLKEVRGRAENFAAEVGTKLLPVVLDAMDMFNRWAGVISAKLAPVIEAAAEDAVQAFSRIGAWWAENGPAITAAIGEVVDKIGEFAAKVGPVLADVFGSLVGAVQAAVKALTPELVSAFKALLGPLGLVAVAAGTTLKAAIDALTAAFKFLDGKIEPIAALIGVVLLPKVIALGVEATISAAKQVAAWVTTSVAALASGTVTVAWLTLSAAEWVKNAVVAAASAVRVAAAWVVTQVAAILAGNVTIAQVAIQIGQWVLLGFHALANAAKIAAAWLIAMGPIAIVAAAIVGFVALWIIHWDTIKEVIQTGARFVVNVFLGLVESVLKAAATAFGWVPGIGPKLREAAQAVERFRDETNAALGGIKDKTVKLTVDQIRNLRIIETTERIGTGGIQARAHGGPVSAGRPYLVGEDGAEIIVPTGSGTVIPNNRLGGGGGTSITYAPQVTVMGNVITERDLAEEMIRQFQEWVRRNGTLGL